MNRRIKNKKGSGINTLLGRVLIAVLVCLIVSPFYATASASSTTTDQLRPLAQPGDPGPPTDPPQPPADPPGKSGDAHGKSGDAHGKSGDAPGKTGEAGPPIDPPGKTGDKGPPIDPPGKTGDKGPPIDPPGKTGDSPSPIVPDEELIDAYTGTWLNTDPNTDGITRIDIFFRGHNPYMHWWGKCYPTDCNNGTERGVWDGDRLVFEFESLNNSGVPFAERLFAMSLSGSTLVVDVYVHFVDDSGRPDYSMTETFTKAASP